MHQLTGPKWLDFAAAGVPGVRVLFAPPLPSTKRKAARASREVLAAHGFIPEPGQPLPDIDPDVLDLAIEASAAVLIRHGIRNWEGLGADDAPADEAVAVSPEAIERFLLDADLFEAANQLYVGPLAERMAEKNASSGSQNGTSADRIQAKATARTARRPAKPVPTKPTSRAPKPVKSPGK